MSSIESFLGWLNQSFEPPTTPPGFRPKGWEIPPKKPGDSDILMTTGKADGTRTTARLPSRALK